MGSRGEVDEIALLERAVADPDFVFGGEPDFVFVKETGAGWTVAFVSRTLRTPAPAAEIVDFRFGVSMVGDFGDPVWTAPSRSH